MLKIGKLTDYGVVVLNHLASKGALQQSVEDMVLATGLNPPTLRKVMKALADAGLVLTRRGAKGGYRIARMPEQISLRDVVEAFEGPIALTECTQDSHECDITEQCTLSDSWGGINMLLMQMLARVTLADIRDPQMFDHLFHQLTQGDDRIQLVNIN